MKSGDDNIEAYPLQEWYNFQPIQRYKALSAEEAEEEFGRWDWSVSLRWRLHLWNYTNLMTDLFRRHKQQNFFSLMMRKRLRPDEDVDLDDPDEAKGKRKGGGAKKSKGIYHIFFSV